MYISKSYLQSLIGRKITLMKSDLDDFKNLKLKPTGRIIGVTPCQQLIIKWFTPHHPNITVDLETDRIHIYAKQKTDCISPKANSSYRNDHKSHRSRIRSKLPS